MTETSAHTPGPWKFSVPRMGFSELRGDGGKRFMLGIAAGGDDERLPEAELEANVRLIAASPDLLEAALDFVAKVDRGEARSTRSYAKFKAALSKALPAPPAPKGD